MDVTSLFRREIFWHLMFWLLYLSIRVFIVQLYPGSLSYRLGMELLELPLKMMALYFVIYILIRKLLLRKRYGLFLSVFVLYIFVTMGLNRLEDYYITYPLIENTVDQYRPAARNLNSTFLTNSITRHEDGLWHLSAAFLNLIYIYPVVGLGAAAYFAKGWYDNYLKVERVQKEMLHAELRLLKDQLHPHFLFNTLNNIYSLSQVKSAKTPEMVHRLSELLGFMLYDANVPLIALTKELQVLKDYIELERLRLGDRLQINFEVAGDLQGKQIAPLILFPFLENCFKHASHKTTDQVWISFRVTMQQNQLIAQIENSLPERLCENKNNEGQSGMGLKNVKQRLELLYPNRFSLKLHNEGSYLVKLQLLLS